MTRSVTGLLLTVGVIWVACGLTWLPGCKSRATGATPPAPATDLSSSDVFTSEECDAAAAEGSIRPLLVQTGDGAKPSALTVDYPLHDSIFPPEIVAPTFLWHDPVETNNAWLIDVCFKSNPHHIYSLTRGKRAAPEIDPRTVTASNVFHESPYQASAKAWTPGENIWSLIKQYSADGEAQVTITGLAYSSAANSSKRSSGAVTLRTSKDPVGAPIFYRDVPLMPSLSQEGIVKPLIENALPLIKWRLRDISKPEAPTVMEGLPTCGNCHSFSRDGQTMAMDIDGPSGDKGARALVAVGKHMFVHNEDVFSWNSFKGPNKETSGGLFPQISPDGRYDIATVHEYESVHVRSYTDYQFLQTFYPTGGIVAFYEKATGKIKPLPGADDRGYVQTNPVWSADGKTIVFLRAKAQPPFPTSQRAQYANDPLETQVQYDLYRVPFNDGKGGTVEPVPGGAQNGMSNSFPKFSPDGKWLVWVQCHTGLLMRPDSQLCIMSSQGGTPRKMNCNTSSMNSWHSWSPNSRWLVFSSKCNTPYTQMFLTHIDENGEDSPAILIPHSTADNRASNVPEFVNIAMDGIEDIETPAMEYRRLIDKGDALGAKGLWADAAIEYKKSIELKGDYPRSLTAYASVLSTQDKLEEAATYARKAIDVDQSFWRAHFCLGFVYSKQGKLLDSIKEFKRTVELAPGNELALYDLGNVLRQNGQLEEALIYYRKAAALASTAGDATAAIGRILLEQNKNAEALPYLRETARANPERYPAAVNALAFILATSPDDHVRDGKEAVRLAEFVCGKTSYRVPPFLDTLSCALAEVGQFDDAISYAEKALALAGTPAPGNAGLASQIQTHLDLFKKHLSVRAEK